MRGWSVIAAALLLTGCAGNGRLSESEAVIQIRNLPSVGIESDDEAKSVMHDVCREFYFGGEAIVLQRLPVTGSPEDMRSLVRLSVEADCPNHIVDVDTFEKNNPL